MDNDTVALGSAGSQVAAPSTLGAFIYNPAALALHPGLRAQADIGLLSTDLRFKSLDSGVTIGNELRSCGQCSPSFLLGVTYDFKIPHLAIGFAAYTPNIPRLSFGNAAVEYQQGQTMLVNFQVAAAYRVFRFLSLGVTFGSSYFSMQSELLASTTLSNDRVPLRFKVQDQWTVSSNFGISAEPLKQLSLGLSITPPIDINASGTLSTALPDQPAIKALGIAIKGNQSALKMRLPTVIRFGIRYRPHSRIAEAARVAIDWALVYEQWSRQQDVDIIPDVTVTSVPVIGDVKLPVISLQRKFKDTYSLRMGAEGMATRWLTLRGGVMYESPASRRGYFDLSLPESHKFSLNVGASFAVGRFFIDVAYGHLFALPVTLTQSAMQPLQVIPSIPGLDSVSPAGAIGNGRYTYSQDAARVALRFHFK